MHSKISAIGVKLLPKNLYSRLTLITVATVITGYAVIYAWTNLDSTLADPGKPLTSTLMKSVINSINDIGTRTDGITSVGGNIGIGTTSPSTKLDVNGNVVINNGGLEIKRTAVYNAISLTNINGVQVHLNANGNSEGNLRTVTNHPLSFSTDNTQRMVINAVGNVGIGTTNPSEKLDIAGTVKATGFSGPINGLKLFIKGGNNGTVTCDQFCAGSQWGPVGSCIGQKRISDSTFYSCSTLINSLVDCACVSR